MQSVFTLRAKHVKLWQTIRSPKTALTLHTLNDCRIVDIADKNAVYAVFTIRVRFAFKKVAVVEEEEE